VAGCEDGNERWGIGRVSLVWGGWREGNFGGVRRGRGGKWGKGEGHVMRGGGGTRWGGGGGTGRVVWLEGEGGGE